MAIVSSTNCIIFAFAIGILSTNAAPSGTKGKLRIGIIGAGPSGLATAKCALDQEHEVVIWEQGEALGGIWYYNNKTGKDKYGTPIYTPMYKELRTNAPYQLLEFPGWKYPEGTQSYPTQKEVWDYINSYAKKFGIDKYVRLHHQVKIVQPIEGNRWRIEVDNMTKKKNRTETGEFDAVFVCSGVFSEPIYPKISGIEKFKRAIHSRDYRNAKAFKKKNVLVIGAGPSGKDITIQVSKYAKRVTLSRHERAGQSEEYLQQQREGFGPKVTLKGDVISLTKNSATFADGTKETFNAAIFATGYAYSYPFLGDDTNIHVENNYVEPLYKQIINIEHPTMAFIGAVTITATMPMCDLQARFALEFITGAKNLPSHDHMLNDMNARNQELWNKGVDKSKTLIIAFNQKNYANELAKTAGIPNMPPVISDLLEDALKTYKTTDPFGFRSNVYTIESDIKFTKVKRN